MRVEQCPECGSKELVCHEQKGECICKDCGLVIDDLMPDHSAYREGTSKTRPQRMDGKIVKSPWLLNAKEKNLQRGRTRIQLLASKLKLPSYIVDQAMELYKKAVFKDLCIGRNSYTVVCACVYITCIQNQIPKTAQEVTSFGSITHTQMLRIVKLLKHELGLKLEPFDPVDLLPRYVSNLGLSHKTLQKASELLEKVKKTNIYSGKSPKSIVAAVIYLAAKLNGEKVVQRIVADETGVIEATIRKRYKEVESILFG